MLSISSSFLVGAFMMVTSTASSANVTSAACRAHDPRAPSVPECPANGSTLLPDSYPAMAVVISDEIGGPEFITEMVTKVLRAQPDLPPQFFLNVSAENLERAKKAVREATTSDPVRREKWLAALTAVGGEAFNWQQDFAQTYAGPDGRPVPRELGHYRERGRQYDALKAAYQETCGIKSGEPIFPERRGYSDGLSGGNIEGGPNGICLLGKDALSPGEFTSYRSRVCGGGEPLDAPTDFLKAGHTDEITSTVRTGPGECDMAMLIASPRAALDAMRADPSGEAFAILDSRDGKTLVQEGKLFDVCKKHLEISPGAVPFSPTEPGAIREKSSGLFQKIIFGEKAFAEPDFIREEMRRRREPKQRPAAGTARSPIERCRGMTNAQFIAAFEAHRDLTRINGLIDDKMDRFRKDAEAAWQKVAPHCPRRIVEWPTLYGGRLADRGTTVTAGGSLFPNVNNLQQFGQTLMIPDPGSETMRGDLRRRAMALGLKADFVNTNGMHREGGNLHCSSNTLRYCRPRAAGGQR